MACFCCRRQLLSLLLQKLYNVAVYKVISFNPFPWTRVARQIRIFSTKTEHPQAVLFALKVPATPLLKEPVISSFLARVGWTVAIITVTIDLHVIACIEVFDMRSIGSYLRIGLRWGCVTAD